MITILPTTLQDSCRQRPASPETEAISTQAASAGAPFFPAAPTGGIRVAASCNALVTSLLSQSIIPNVDDDDGANVGMSAASTSSLAMSARTELDRSASTAAGASFMNRPAHDGGGSSVPGSAAAVVYYTMPADAQLVKLPVPVNSGTGVTPRPTQAPTTVRFVAGGSQLTVATVNSSLDPRPLTSNHGNQTSAKVEPTAANNGMAAIIKTEPGYPMANSSEVAQQPRSVSLISAGEHGRLKTGGELSVAGTLRSTSPAKPETAAVNGCDVFRASGGNAAPTTTGTGKTFSCPMCQRDFSSEKYLSMHVSLHQLPVLQQQTGNLMTLALERQIMALQPATTTGDENLAENRTVQPGMELHSTGQHLLPIPGQVFTTSSSSSSSSSSGSAFPPMPSSTAAGILPIMTQQAVVKQPIPPPIRRPKAGNGGLSGGGGGHWMCQLCEKTFAQNSNYKNHIRTHSNERPFVCDICSIGFKERYHLKKHVLFKHTDEMREECRVCGKRFKDSTAVRAHERTHSDLRPYGCPRCDKTFKTSECLWHHENRSKTCGKSLGDLPVQAATVAPAAKRSETATATPVVAGGVEIVRPARRGRAAQNRNCAKGNNKQTVAAAATVGQTPIATAAPSYVLQPTTLVYPSSQQQLFRFPIEDEQMVCTEVVVSDEQQRQRQQPGGGFDAGRQSNGGFCSAGGMGYQPSPTTFASTMASISDVQSPSDRTTDRISGNFSGGSPAVAESATASATSIDRVLMRASTASSSSAAASRTTHSAGGEPGFDWETLMRRSNAENQQQQQHLLQRHHHQQQQSLQLQQHRPVEVKIEAEMMDLLDCNLTALNQSADSSLFDDFPIGDDEDDTDYYKKFVDENQDEGHCLDAADGVGDASQGGPGSRNESLSDNNGDKKVLLMHENGDDYWRTMNQSTTLPAVSSHHPFSAIVVSSSSFQTAHPQAATAADALPPIAIPKVPSSPSGLQAVPCGPPRAQSSPIAPTRPYWCDQCSVGFKLKVHLKKHNLYKHSNEYPCECSVCGKRFKDSSAVRLHERIHSAARPFECQRCGKSFKTRENLWGHRHRGPCDRVVVVGAPVEVGAVSGVDEPEVAVIDQTSTRVDEASGDRPDQHQPQEEHDGLLHCQPFHQQAHQQIIGFGTGEQFVVQASDGRKFIAQLATTDYNCNNAPRQVLLGFAGASGNLVQVGWAASSTGQERSPGQPQHQQQLSALAGEAAAATVPLPPQLMARRVIGRQGQPSMPSAVRAAPSTNATAAAVSAWLTAAVPTTANSISLPTAVVAPIKRELPEHQDEICRSQHSTPPSQSYGIACVAPTAAALSSQHSVYGVSPQQETADDATYSGYEKYLLPPFETLISSSSHRLPGAEFSPSPIESISGSRAATLTTTATASENVCQNSGKRSMVAGVGAALSSSPSADDGSFMSSMVRLPGIDQLFQKSPCAPGDALVGGVPSAPKSAQMYSSFIDHHHQHQLIGHHLPPLTNFVDFQTDPSKKTTDEVVYVLQRNHLNRQVDFASPADAERLPPPPPYPGTPRQSTSAVFRFDVGGCIAVNRK